MELRNWKVGRIGEKGTLAWGNVQGHPNILDGTYVHTGKIRKAFIEDTDQCLWIWTRPGHRYKLKWKEIDDRGIVNTWDDMWDALESMGISGRLLFTCLGKKEEERLSGKKS